MEIRNLHDLDREFKRLKKAKEELQEYKNFRDAEVQRLDKWLEEVSKPLEDTITYHENKIIYYMRMLREEQGKKSISTPNGRVRSTARRESVRQGDKKKLLDYVLENNIDEAVKPSLNWSGLKDRLAVSGHRVVDTQTGEVVEGAEVSPAKVNYKVEVE